MRFLALFIHVCGALRCPDTTALGPVTKCAYIPSFGGIEVYHGPETAGVITIAVGCDGDAATSYCALGFGKGMSGTKVATGVSTHSLSALKLTAGDFGAEEAGFITNAKNQDVDGTKYVIFDVAVDKLDGTVELADFIIAKGAMTADKPAYHNGQKTNFCFNFKNSHYAEGACTAGPLGPAESDGDKPDIEGKKPPIEEDADNGEPDNTTEAPKRPPKIPPVRPPVRPPTVCKDIADKGCHKEYCSEKSPHHRWTAKNCKKTCKLCVAHQHSVCKDKDSANCYVEYCEADSEYYPWTKKNCKKTCGICGCQDDYEEGCHKEYCDKNSPHYAFNKKHCRKTCGICEEKPEEGSCENKKLTKAGKKTKCNLRKTRCKTHKPWMTKYCPAICGFC